MQCFYEQAYCNICSGKQCKQLPMRLERLQAQSVSSAIVSLASACLTNDLAQNLDFFVRQCREGSNITNIDVALCEQQGLQTCFLKVLHCSGVACDFSSTQKTGRKVFFTLGSTACHSVSNTIIIIVMVILTIIIIVMVILTITIIGVEIVDAIQTLLNSR